MDHQSTLLSNLLCAPSADPFNENNHHYIPLFQSRSTSEKLFNYYPSRNLNFNLIPCFDWLVEDFDNWFYSLAHDTLAFSPLLRNNPSLSLSLFRQRRQVLFDFPLGLFNVTTQPPASGTWTLALAIWIFWFRSLALMWGDVTFAFVACLYPWGMGLGSFFAASNWIST